MAAGDGSLSSRSKRSSSGSMPQPRGAHNSSIGVRPRRGSGGGGGGGRSRRPRRAPPQSRRRAFAREVGGEGVARTGGRRRVLHAVGEQVGLRDREHQALAAADAAADDLGGLRLHAGVGGHGIERGVGAVGRRRAHPIKDAMARRAQRQRSAAPPPAVEAAAASAGGTGGGSEATGAPPEPRASCGGSGSTISAANPRSAATAHATSAGTSMSESLCDQFIRSRHHGVHLLGT